MSEQDRIAFEEFIAELDFQDIAHDTESIRNLYRRAWQAATAEANKRIEALESEVAKWQDIAVRHAKYEEEADLRNDELQASNNVLREALEDIATDAGGCFNSGYSAGFVARNALASTPAQ